MDKFYRTAVEQYHDKLVICHVHTIERKSTTKTATTTFSTSSSRTPGLTVEFLLSYISDISFHFVERNDLGKRHIVSKAPLPKQEASAVIVNALSTSNEYVRKVIAGKLERLIVPPRLRHEMIERGMDEATWLVKSRPPDHNYVSVDLCMRVGLVFDFDETMMPIFDDGLCGQFAKHAVVAVVSETCSICLIDFSDDDGRGGLKSVFTPCGHKFHRHCINEWLKSRARTRSWRPITPFCPICRCDIEARAL